MQTGGDFAAHYRTGAGEESGADYSPVCFISGLSFDCVQPCISNGDFEAQPVADWSYQVPLLWSHGGYGGKRQSYLQKRQPYCPRICAHKPHTCTGHVRRMNVESSSCASGGVATATVDSGSSAWGSLAAPSGAAFQALTQPSAYLEQIVTGLVRNSCIEDFSRQEEPCKPPVSICQEQPRLVSVSL